MWLFLTVISTQPMAAIAIVALTIIPFQKRVSDIFIYKIGNKFTVKIKVLIAEFNLSLIKI